MNFKELKERIRAGNTTTHLVHTFLIYGLIALSIIVTKVLIARFYGQEELGLFSYFFSLVTIVFLFTSLGFPEAVTQTIVKEPEKLRRAVYYAFIFIVPSTMIIILPLVLTNFFMMPELKVHFVVYIVAYTLFYFTYSILRGFKKFAEGSWYSLANRIIFIAIVIWLGLRQVNFISVLFGLSVALVLATIISLPRLILFWRDNWKNNSEDKLGDWSKKEFISLAFSLFLMQAGFYLLRETDTLIIPYLTGFTQLGLYSAHSSISNIIRLIAYVFPVVVLPMAAISRYKMKESFYKIIKLLVPFSLLILIATYVFVPLLYGEQYTDYILPIFLVISSALLVIYSYFNSVFVGENKSSRFYFKILTIDFLLSLIVNTGLIIILVRSLGILGAPLATTIVVIIKILLNIYGIKRLRTQSGEKSDTIALKKEKDINTGSLLTVDNPDS